MKAMVHYEQHAIDGHYYTCSTQPETWSRHTGHDCITCKKVDVQLNRGRPAKWAKGRGHPKLQEDCEHVVAHTAEHVDAIAPAALKPPETDPLLGLDTHPLPGEDVASPQGLGAHHSPGQDAHPSPGQGIHPLTQKDVASSSEQDVFTPSSINLRNVLNAPVDKTPTMIEQRAATHIIRQMIHSSCARATEQDLRQPTGGPVSKLLHMSYLAPRD